MVRLRPFFGTSCTRIFVGPKIRREEFRNGAVQVLEHWRHDTYKTHYLRRPWGPHSLLPDNILSSLASKRMIRTVQDLINEGWSATHAEKHGQDILKQLADYDIGHFKDLEDKREEKKRQTEGRRAREGEEAKRLRAEAKAIRQAQPKPPRPSRAKKSKNILGDSTILNTASSFQLATLVPSPAVLPALLASSSQVPALVPSPVSASAPIPVALPGLMPSPVITQPLGPSGYYYYYHPGYHYPQQYQYIPQYSQPQNQSLFPGSGSRHQ